MRLLKLVPDNTNIDFMKWRHVALMLSILITAAAIALVAVRGLNLGVDFIGGQSVQVTFAQAPDLDDLRNRVDGLGHGESTLQEFGAPNVIAIRMPLPEGGEAAAAQVASQVRQTISERYPDARFDAVETVSGKVSEELFRSGALAIALAMLGIAIYIWVRFEWQFGVGALITLFHDVAMTMGFFALTQLEFNLNVIAAVLTIVGYSLNDTVVIYDRIRENLRKYRKMEIVPLLNLSLNETLSRTMVTSLSILLALGALLLFGPDVIFGLTIAIFIGIFVGTYSSIYVSSPVLTLLGVSSDSFLPRDPVGRAERGGPRNESHDGARV
ncbi:protein translocase subunit SecF [Sphingosinicella sp. LHD-64]|uniref:protein translocase subunit SecF n=1 Tax=Sphingosinicella sp. LHD-64 TaxID=3072139 RepID=UPI00280DF7F9|nr:protein translocase subunit SecF [Sphingosinicella sp. LHD-64]MDQ8755959.1 protein translocase subunit SecF [Sphingosinicella sp. LHD-64]